MQRERVDGTPEALPRVEEAPLPRVGETIAVRPDVQDVEHTTRVVAPRDRIRWGPIWAGLLTVLGVFLLLSVLAIGIGAQTVEPGVTRGHGGHDDGVGKRDHRLDRVLHRRLGGRHGFGRAWYGGRAAERVPGMGARDCLDFGDVGLRVGAALWDRG